MSDKPATEVVLADAHGIARAAQILESGGLVAVPTETVYGLAARADSPVAVAKIYTAKGRPDFNPLIVHVRDAAQAARFAQWGTSADEAAQRYWPGPLTMVLPKRRNAGVAEAVSAGLETIAVRSPAHPVMQDLLAQVDFPLAAPSANRSGLISPTSAVHVLASLDGRIDLVLDGGATQQGVESTIVALRDGQMWEELRPGPVSLGALRSTAAQNSKPEQSDIEAPGQLASHYSPGKPVRLNADSTEPDEFFIGFGGGAADFNLSAAADLSEAASRLYDALHHAASSDKPRIAVGGIPEEGIGRAINDRLRRAAAPAD